MRFSKKERKYVVIINFIGLGLIACYFIELYLINGLPSEYQSICYSVVNFTFGIAFLFLLFIDGFFVFLKMQPDGNGKGVF